jgi:hypothetical protein
MKGASFPPGCAISARFIADIRNICYRYKRNLHGDAYIDGGATELSDGVLDDEPGATFLPPQNSPVRALAITYHTATAPTKIVSIVR